MGFYQANSKILTRSIKGSETIDFNKFPDLLDILFNHWISQKENYNRIKKIFKRGEFELSISVVEDEFGITNKKARNLIKKFIEDEIILLVKKGCSYNKKSLYVYLSTLEKYENEDLVKGIVKTEAGLSETLENQRIKYNEGHSEDLVKDLVKGNSKKELIKRINKKEIYSEIIEIFNSTCSGLSKVTKITDKRKNALDKILREYDHDLNQIFEVFRNSSKSKFMNGDNQANWKASFDWIINPNNFIKVLEGNYNIQEQQNAEECEPLEIELKL